MSARGRLLVIVASAVLWQALGNTADAGGHCKNLDSRACEVAHHGPLVPIVGAALAGLAAVVAGALAGVGGASAAVSAARASAAAAAASASAAATTIPTMPREGPAMTEGPAPEAAEPEPEAGPEPPGEVPIDPGDLEEWVLGELERLPIDPAARDEIGEALAGESDTVAPEPAATGDTTEESEVPEAAGGAEESDGTTDTTPLAPGLGEVRDIGDLAGEVADAVESVGEEIDDLPIDDDTKEAIKDRLGEIGETAGTVRDVAKTAEEYIEALDENLDRTGRMGIDDRSRDFLGWFRVVFRGIGELGEKFVDSLVRPLSAPLGETAGEKVEELLHGAVPIKEFGDELGKFPTSAAHHAIGASRRDQLEDAQRAWADPTEPDPDDLRDLWRFSVPPQ